jgi:hypothetical protein
VLYILFNACLLLGEITSQGGDMGFVDDYIAWVVGESTDENTTLLQERVIPRVTAWERESGAIFEAEKTKLIHFTRVPGRALQPGKPLRMPQRAPTLGAPEPEVFIGPDPVVKILGVYMDSQLRMISHYQQAARKASTQAVALGSLRGLKPGAMR